MEEGAGLRIRWRERLAERVISIAFYLSVIGVAGVGLLSYYLVARMQDTEASVLHATTAISRLEALHRTLVEAESAGRAYLITGHQTFRDSFNSKMAGIDRELHDFKTFTSQNQVQQRLTAELLPTID